MAESILITFKKFPVYRGAGLVGAAVVALLFVTWFTAKPAGAQETIVEDSSYTVNERTSGVATSTRVKKGDRVIFTASGTIWPAGFNNPFYPSTGPQGYNETADCDNTNSNWPAPCERKFSLIGQLEPINTDDGWFYIGTGGQQIYSKDVQGAVYLTHNDDVPGNGEGSFEVNVKVYRDITPPNTTISSAPSSVTNTKQASFHFSSSEANSTFECKLDGGAYEACNSGKDYTNLSDGQHTFLVRARDALGNVDPSPASHVWTVDATAPTLDTDNTDGSDGVTPDKGATGVSRLINVKATFSEANSMDPATLTTSTVTLIKAGSTTSVVAAVSYDEATKTVTLNPFPDNPTQKLARSTTYTVRIEGAKDLAGNPLATATWTFKTKRR
jgi:hypothetical protein